MVSGSVLIFEGWTGRFLIVYLGWPVIVMFSFLMWSSIRAFSVIGILKGILFTVTFAALASLGWILGSLVLLFFITLSLNWVGASSSSEQVTIFIVMAIAMTIGAVLGWRYLLKEVGPDPRDWTI